MAKRSDITDREALEACWAPGKTGNCSPLAILSERYPEKVVLRKLEQIDDRGWIDYGVSIAYAWRTPEGEEALRGMGA